jgi:hypothetical protein
MKQLPKTYENSQKKEGVFEVNYNTMFRDVL